MYRKWKDGIISQVDYQNWLVQQRGYKNWNEYCKLQGKNIRPMITNNKVSKTSPDYLGITVSERVLSKVFKNVQRMPTCNRNYDFICNKGYKVDVKSSCQNNLTNRKDKYWQFKIKYNIIADYFLLLAFDSRINLSPQHVWLIQGNSNIGVNKVSILNKKNQIVICNTKRSLMHYKKYELKDKLRKVITCCNILKKR